VAFDPVATDEWLDDHGQHPGPVLTSEESQ